MIHPSRSLLAVQWARQAIFWAACTVVVITMTATGCTLMLGVIVRYILHGSLAWSAELPVILFPWMIMGGVVVAAANDKHLGVDYMVRRLPSRVSVLIDIGTRLLLIVLMAEVVAQAPALLRFLQYQTTPVLGWPASWAFYSIPAGAVGVATLALLSLPDRVAAMYAAPSGNSLP